MFIHLNRKKKYFLKNCFSLMIKESLIFLRRQIRQERRDFKRLFYFRRCYRLARNRIFYNGFLSTHLLTRTRHEKIEVEEKKEETNKNVKENKRKTIRVNGGKDVIKK